MNKNFFIIILTLLLGHLSWAETHEIESSSFYDEIVSTDEILKESLSTPIGSQNSKIDPRITYPRQVSNLSVGGKTVQKDLLPVSSGYFFYFSFTDSDSAYQTPHYVCSVYKQRLYIKFSVFRI